MVGGFLISLPRVTAALGSLLFFLPAAVRMQPMLPLIVLIIAVMLASMLFTVRRVRETVPATAPDRSGAHILRRAFLFDVRGEASFAWLLAARGCNIMYEKTK